MGDSYPVSDEYVIGPGDEIIVKLWGRLEGTHRMRVDRDGKIFFPKLGPMYVAGKTFGELKTYIRKKVGAIAEVRADVLLGELKGFPVSVVGEVKAPGMYQVSSFHTALQSITMAGGIKDIGTLRRVQIKRGGETVTDIDIYDFLLKGDITHDIRLHTGDAIFVPVAGPLVAVVGEVRRQAIYELKQEKSIGDVLAMAGGLSPSAYKRRVQVERLEGNLARTVVDLNLEEIEKSLSSFALQDGDILRVLSVLPEEENVVQVEGNIQRPGKYEWKKGLTVGSLIPDEQFFLPERHRAGCRFRRTAQAYGHADGVEHNRIPGDEDGHGGRRGARPGRKRDLPGDAGLRPRHAGWRGDAERLAERGGTVPARRAEKDGHPQDRPRQGDDGG
jgi:protein involved in polysaccharide export with SLBB domain